jgi:hypothetical protein
MINTGIDLWRGDPEDDILCTEHLMEMDGQDIMRFDRIGAMASFFTSANVGLGANPVRCARCKEAGQ